MIFHDIRSHGRGRNKITRIHTSLRKQRAKQNIRNTQLPKRGDTGRGREIISFGHDVHFFTGC